MRCQEAQVLLSARRDLNMSQRAELEAHLVTCRGCAAARREEDRVSRLLASLPDPGLAPPPRVAAAVAARAARRSVAARRQRGLAFALSLGAVAVFAGLLLNMAAGGRLGGLLFGRPGEARTAGQPGDGPAPPAADDTLYLIHQPDGLGASVIAWRPGADEVLFRAPLGRPPVFQIVPEISTAPPVEVQLPPRDVALAPDGASLYVLEYRDDAIELVAYDLPLGAARWRQPMRDYSPYSSREGGSNLSVSPDGTRVFVRGIAPTRVRVGAPPELELRAFETGGGRELGAPTRLSDMSQILPLNQHEILLFNPQGGGMARGALGPAGPWHYLDQSIAAGVLLSDRRTVRAVTPDLKVVEIALVEGDLRLVEEIDLVERGGYFFDHAAFSPDGEVLAVGETTFDPLTGLVDSEVRIFRAGPWREVGRHTFNRVLDGLAVSADGARLLGLTSARGASRLVLAPGSVLPTEAAAPKPLPSLVTFEIGGDGAVTVRELDGAVVGFLAGR